MPPSKSLPLQGRPLQPSTSTPSTPSTPSTSTPSPPSTAGRRTDSMTQTPGLKARLVALPGTVPEVGHLSDRGRGREDVGVGRVPPARGAGGVAGVGEGRWTQHRSGLGAEGIGGVERVCPHRPTDDGDQRVAVVWSRTVAGHGPPSHGGASTSTPSNLSHQQP